MTEEHENHKFEVTQTESIIQQDTPAPPNLIGRLLKKYVVISKIDEGSFGAIFLAKKLTKEKIVIDKNFSCTDISEDELGKYQVIKAESNFTEGGCGLKMEVEILKKIHQIFPDTEQFVKINEPSRRNLYSYVFMTLLGKSLKDLVKDLPDRQFSIGTWSRIGIQGLFAVKQLHEAGYIHRDLKPANFVLGHKNDSKRCRFIHLIDFGLSRGFITIINGVRWHRKPRKVVDFRGTEFYCSQSMHFDLEQQRIDDIWGLIFTLMEMYKGLPWSFVNQSEVEAKKKTTKLIDILNFLPTELAKSLTNLNNIERRGRPNYEEIYDRYDWEKVVNSKAPSMEKFECMHEEFKKDRLSDLNIIKNGEYQQISNRSVKNNTPLDTNVSVCFGP
ncbi:Asator [Strongyloides ratti]|uniref:non-specific serine/threonine protein kinase n=1 Tax=Strongyloides ratti TaxID=34506 RepID=A0A090LBG4_STRRB|nr:Asator [Strongyloides ratti]CEF64860.1 Asator [Strongyloides ratti]